MFPRADIVGTRPVASIEATRPIVPVGDTHQELSQRLNRIALGSFLEGEVLSRLQDGSFVVKVADSAVRMNLPGGTQVGETLDLTLVATQPRPAFLLNTPVRDNPAALSSTGRLLDWIIHTAKASGAPEALAGKAPLLPSPNADAGQIAASIKDSVEFSGLFYESHLEHWASGERPLAMLLREPQVKNGASQLIETALRAALPGTSPTGAEHIARLIANLGNQPDAAHSLMAILHAAHQSDPGLQAAETKSSAPLPPPNLQSDSEALPALSADTRSEDTSLVAERNLVNAATGRLTPETENAMLQKTMSSESVNMINLQLNALEQHQIAWQGELWPGQKIEWEIGEDTPHGEHAETQERAWQSVIRFELPTLGKVSATVRLAGNRLQIQVRTANEDTATLLRQHGDALSNALAAAGSPLEQFSVNRETEK